MKEKNILIDILSELLKYHDFSKNKNYWFREQADIVQRVELQRSNYSRDYYINLSLELKSLRTKPGNVTPHIVLRIDDLLNRADLSELQNALSLEREMGIAERKRKLQSVINSALIPFFDQHQTERDLTVSLRSNKILQNRAVLVIKNYLGVE